MTIPVKWFHGGMTGAPTPGNAAGTLITILDACLINGFNVASVDSLSYDSGTGKCTATVGAGHGFIDDQVVLIEGASDTAYNGEVRVTVIDPQNFSYTPVSTPTTTPLTGSITAKAAPVGGWNKAFSDVSKGVYVSTDTLATGNHLRVDDSLGTDGAQVTAYESMTDVNTGTGQWANGYWRKADATRSMGEWVLVGDPRAFYLLIGSGNYRCVYFFGDFESFLAGDGYNCALTFNTNASAGNMNAEGCVTDFNIATGHAMHRDLTTTQTGVPYKPIALTKMGLHPDPVTGGVAALKGVLLCENDSGWRGLLPGSYQLLSPAHMAIYKSALCLNGKNYIAIDLEAWR